MRVATIKILLPLFICVVVIVAVSAFALAQDNADDFTPIADHADVIAEWEGSAHGNTYSVNKGPNTYCSRCHSPQNWDPESRADDPPNCVTCHFAHEAEMRFAETMEFVAEEDWVGIGCDTCHVTEGDMIDVTGFAWYNPISAEYQTVDTPNQLCGMCHTNSTGVSTTGGRGVDHEVILGGSAHNNWAATLGERRPDYCTDCHNPHTQRPLGCIDCHEGVTTLETHAGGGTANATHLAAVSCIACHDASGAEVGPHPDEAMGGIFTTVETAMGRSGTVTTTPILSHSVQWLVDCERCHFEENTWELPTFGDAGS